MLEQRIAKHTLNSVVEVLKIDTIFTLFSLKSNPFPCIIRKSIYFHGRHLKTPSIETLDLYKAKANFLCFITKDVVIKYYM